MGELLPPARLEVLPQGWRGRFEAMASPCELLIEGGDRALAAALLDTAQAEALRIEHKYSRYRDDSVLARLHAADGRPVEVDDETALLLDFAARCHALSGGRFDITSGVLRAAWRFDGSDRLPAPETVAALLPRIGWPRVQWARPWLTLPAGMELDLGGLGKEYAVDRVLGLLRRQLQVQAGSADAVALLVNFGGDLAVGGPRADGSAWQIGIETPAGAPAVPLARPDAAAQLALRAGGLATSGDARRFLLKDGVRYSHILDPRDGWPVRGAPRSVTVAAPSCIEAGVLATLAMLQGPGAEAWLQAQGLPHWVLR
ncbi:MAG: FAD:protein FMN transferase [Burkholderiaceae bacterium]|nr:FAD:protein FMN transferase [Burkholderiaceae bacterium]